MFVHFFSLALTAFDGFWRFRGKKTAPQPPSQREASVCSPAGAAAAGPLAEQVLSRGPWGRRISCLYAKPRQRWLSGQLQTAREVPSSDRTLRFSRWLGLRAPGLRAPLPGEGLGRGASSSIGSIAAWVYRRVGPRTPGWACTSLRGG